MDRPNWKLILPAAAAGGFVLIGFWGLLVGPVGTAWYLSWRNRRDRGEGPHEEDGRLAVFMAEAAKAQMAAAARKAPANTAAPAALAPTPAAKTAAGVPPASPPAPKPSFGEMRARAQRLEGKALLDAYAAARLGLLENPRDSHAAVEAALLARRAAAAQAPLRLRAASRAIAVCLDGGQSAMAAALFGEFVAERTALQLSAAHWEPLGRALLAQGALMEAAWAMHAGAVLANDFAAAQKRLIEVAGKAAESGKPSVALKLYRTLLSKYPDSQFADFVRSNMRVEEKNLARKPAAG